MHRNIKCSSLSGLCDPRGLIRSFRPTDWLSPVYESSACDQLRRRFWKQRLRNLRFRMRFKFERICLQHTPATKHQAMNSRRRRKRCPSHGHVHDWQQNPLVVGDRREWVCLKAVWKFYPFRCKPGTWRRCDGPKTILCVTVQHSHVRIDGKNSVEQGIYMSLRLFSSQACPRSMCTLVGKHMWVPIPPYASKSIFLNKSFVPSLHAILIVFAMVSLQGNMKLSVWHPSVA